MDLVYWTLHFVYTFKSLSVLNIILTFSFLYTYLHITLIHVNYNSHPNCDISSIFSISPCLSSHLSYEILLFILLPCTVCLQQHNWAVPKHSPVVDTTGNNPSTIPPNSKSMFKCKLPISSPSEYTWTLTPFLSISFGAIYIC